ncbi:MAG: helix-hairpin-helix domain-containing protein [Lachnotalea sp.]
MQKGKIIKISIIISIFVVCGCLYSCKDNEKTVVSFEDNSNNEENATESKTNIDVDKEEEPEQEIYVYICGEILNPGVYQVEQGARMYQVVELAGGVLDTGAENYLNLAESVSDGQKIVVPSQEEAKQLEVIQEEASSQYININTANEETLTTLPGIGASKAKSIISYRESKGGFTSIEELMEIEGIKEGVYNKVKDMITIN